MMKFNAVIVKNLGGMAVKNLRINKPPHETPFAHKVYLQSEVRNPEILLLNKLMLH